METWHRRNSEGASRSSLWNITTRQMRWKKLQNHGADRPFWNFCFRCVLQDHVSISPHDTGIRRINSNSAQASGGAYASSLIAPTRGNARPALTWTPRAWHAEKAAALDSSARSNAICRAPCFIFRATPTRDHCGPLSSATQWLWAVKIVEYGFAIGFTKSYNSCN